MVPGMMVIAISLGLAAAGFVFATGGGLVMTLFTYSISGLACILAIAGGRAMFPATCAGESDEARHRAEAKALRLD